MKPELPNVSFFNDYQTRQVEELGVTYRELSERLKPQNKGKFSAGLLVASMLAFMNTNIDDLFEKKGIFQDITPTDEIDPVKDEVDPEDVPVD